MSSKISGSVKAASASSTLHCPAKRSEDGPTARGRPNSRGGREEAGGEEEEEEEEAEEAVAGRLTLLAVATVKP